MRSFYNSLALASGLFSSLIHAAPSALVPDELVSRASTCNTPTNRACWTSGFNINTDYETNIPTTGNTRVVSFFFWFFSFCLATSAGRGYIIIFFRFRANESLQYNLVVTEIQNYVAPDGQVKPVAMLINSKLPSPN